MSKQTNPLDSRLSKMNNCLYRVSTKALIFDGQKIFLIKEWDDEWWSFPGGGVEYNETLPEALHRELLEELSLAKEDIILHPEILHFGIGAVVEKLPMANIFYRVDVRKNKIQPTKEVVSSQWFSLDEIKQLKLVPTTSDTDKLFEIIKKELNRSK